MFNRSVAVVAAILIPTLAFGQRTKTRGDEKADWGTINKAGGGGLQLSNRDVEDISPLKLLIDKRKDLKLSDDQLKQFKDLESKLKDKNQPLFKSMDSLRSEMKPPAHTPTDEDRAKMMSARGAVSEVLSSIRGNYDASVKDATALLDESQRNTANELLGKQSKDAEEMLNEKLGGGTKDAGDAGAAKGKRGKPPVTGALI
jgi:hypothetical protein